MGHSYDTLPAAVDAESPLSPSDLLVLRHQFDAESAKGWCSVQTKFNLAWGLVKSSDKAFVSEGVEMFMGKHLSYCYDEPRPGLLLVVQVDRVKPTRFRA